MYGPLSASLALLFAFLSVIFYSMFSVPANMAESSNLLTFPENLKIGFASASYQIEGAWNVDGKGESIWDRFTHRPDSNIVDQSNGDIAADSYKHYKQDVALIKDLGGSVYRFSISWPRLLPTGFANKVNPAAVDYYNNLINELLANGIEPFITLYHWDLPQPLQDIGGWPNEKMIDYFEDYARVAFTYFGDRVKKWITFNEPWEASFLCYGLGMFAPGVKGNGVAEYLAAHTILKAHARAYHIYDREFRPTQNGVIGITLSTSWFEPKTNSPEDVKAAERKREFYIGWFAHPIFTEKGDYPEIMKQTITGKSKQEGFPRSRLPEFDEFWISYIRGTSDFFGVNHYTTQLISSSGKSEGGTGWSTDSGGSSSQHPDWPTTGSSWFRVVPFGFRKSLAYVRNTYNNPIVFVTENGVSDKGGLDDDKRVQFYNSYLKEMLKAIYNDGVNIQVYTAWSLLDDFEWVAGYSEKFGIIHVDFNDPDRKRTPKKSAEYFRRILKERRIDA